jgi:hypothetical protein
LAFVMLIMVSDSNECWETGLGRQKIHAARLVEDDGRDDH